MRHLTVLMLLFTSGTVACSSSEKQWNKARSENTVEAYDAFLAKGIEEFADSASYYREKLFFDAARREGTPAALTGFIRDFPGGHFYAAAGDALEVMEYALAEEDGSYAAWSQFLREYPESRYATHVSQIVDSLRAPLIEDGIKAGIKNYFGGNESEDKELSIKTIGGVAFSKLLHTMSVVGAGIIEIDAHGRAIPSAGSEIMAEMYLPQDKERPFLKAMGIANGKRGFKEIRELELTGRIEVLTAGGARFTFDGDTWSRTPAR
jgi:hypothetical protein